MIGIAHFLREIPSTYSSLWINKLNSLVWCLWMCGFARIDGTHKLIVLLLFFLYMFFCGVVNVDQVFKFFFLKYKFLFLCLVCNFRLELLFSFIESQSKGFLNFWILGQNWYNTIHRLEMLIYCGAPKSWFSTIVIYICVYV